MNKDRLRAFLVFCALLAFFIYDVLEQKVYLSHGIVITYDESPIMFVLTLAINIGLMILFLVVAIKGDK